MSLCRQTITDHKTQVLFLIIKPKTNDAGGVVSWGKFLLNPSQELRRPARSRSRRTRKNLECCRRIVWTRG